MFMGVESRWDPVFILGTRFFKPMGSQDPVFLTPSANTGLTKIKELTEMRYENLVRLSQDREQWRNMTAVGGWVGSGLIWKKRIGKSSQDSPVCCTSADINKKVDN